MFSFSEIKKNLTSILQNSVEQKKVKILAPMNLKIPETGLVKFLFSKSLCLPHTAFNAFEVKRETIPLVSNKEMKDVGDNRSTEEDGVQCLDV